MSGSMNISIIESQIRIAAIQYAQKKVESFEEFSQLIHYWVSSAAAQHADFVVFPELFTLQILTTSPRLLNAGEALALLNHYTLKIEKQLRRLALQHRINIIGGSHLLSRPNGQVENVCFIALRDGTLHRQAKRQISRQEAQLWGTQAGELPMAIDTDCGRIGILIGQDIENPTLSQHLAAQGASLVFTPFSAALAGQYLRLRQAAQARVLEQPLFCVLCGNVGMLHGVVGLGAQYAQSTVLCACDFAASHQGIISEAMPNTEMLLLADVQPLQLRAAFRENLGLSDEHSVISPDSVIAKLPNKKVTAARSSVPPSVIPVVRAYNSPASTLNRPY